MSNTEKIREKIRGNGYWRVVIRPAVGEYEKNRINVSDLKSVIETAQVRLRGWYYPFYHTQQPGALSGERKWGDICDFEGHIESWEFTTSGQFAQILAISEDHLIDADHAERIRKSYPFQRPEGKNISKFLEVTRTVFLFTEIYSFAANLAQLKSFERVKEFEIYIELHGVSNRMLYIEEWGRHLSEQYICKFEKDVVAFQSLHHIEEIVAKYDVFALEKSIKTFEFFGWANPSMQVLREDQRKLIERRL